MAIKPQRPLPHQHSWQELRCPFVSPPRWLAGGTDGGREPRQPQAGQCVSELCGTPLLMVGVGNAPRSVCQGGG